MGRKFRPDDWALFWTLEPTQNDLDNLDLSTVSRVQLTYTLARDKPQVLDLLKQKGKDVVLRATPEDLDVSWKRSDVLARMAGLKARAHVVGFIGWNEPEGNVNWMFENADGSPADWQRVYARQHAAEVSEFADEWKVKHPDVPLVAPPWSVHAISEDEAPQPGMEVWNDETRYAYVKCAGGRAVHWYAYNWDNVNGVNVNLIRFKLRSEIDAGFAHQPLWVDEVGIKAASFPKLDKMYGYCEMTDWLLSPQQQRAGFMGTRVCHFSPFLSNGGPEWKDYLLQDRACYEVLRTYMKKWSAM